MKGNLLLKESEFSTAVNKMALFAEALSTSLDTYLSLLSELQTNAVNDGRICAEVSALAEQVTAARTPIDSLSEALAEELAQFFAEAEEKDCFSFPSDFMTEVTSRLSALFS